MPEHPEHRAILDEHADLLRSLAEIEALVEESGNAGADTPAAAIAAPGLRRLMDHLGDTLPGHFKREEEGFLVSLAVERPELSPALEKLGQEHGELLAAITTIQRRAAQAPDCALAAAIRDDTRRFLKRLRDHERRETALLQESSLRDLGISA